MTAAVLIFLFLEKPPPLLITKYFFFPFKGTARRMLIAEVDTGLEQPRSEVSLVQR